MIPGDIGAEIAASAPGRRQRCASGAARRPLPPGGRYLAASARGDRRSAPQLRDLTAARARQADPSPRRQRRPRRSPGLVRPSRGSVAARATGDGYLTDHGRRRGHLAALAARIAAAGDGGGEQRCARRAAADRVPPRPDLSAAASWERAWQGPARRAQRSAGPCGGGRGSLP